MSLNNCKIGLNLKMLGITVYSILCVADQCLNSIRLIYWVKYIFYITESHFAGSFLSNFGLDLFFFWVYVQ